MAEGTSAFGRTVSFGAHREVARVMTDDGVFYVGICKTIDQFVTPACSTIEEFAEYAVEHLSLYGETRSSREYWAEAARMTTLVYPLCRADLFAMIGSIGRLKRGEELSLVDVLRLRLLKRFITELLGEKCLNAQFFVEELHEKMFARKGLRAYYKEDWNWSSILDEVVDSVLFPEHSVSETPVDLMRKYTGWYLAELVKIAQLGGRNKLSPLQAMRKFFSPI